MPWRIWSGSGLLAAVNTARFRGPISTWLFEVDHIIAEHHLGQTEAKNLCLACFACNRHKGPNVGGLDPRTKKIVSLYHPRRHKWSRHFRWVGPVLEKEKGTSLYLDAVRET